MNRIAKALRVGLLLLGLAVFGSAARAQDVPPLDKIQSQAELDKAIAALDAGLFDAYNKCDLEKFASYFTENVEFYHDQGGVTLGRAALTESVKKNICGKVTRELVPGPEEGAGPGEPRIGQQTEVFGIDGQSGGVAHRAGS